MNEIFTRRSIRKYQDKNISPDLIEQLLKAAMAAPSAGNQRPWEFIVIDDPELLARVPEAHPYSSMVPNAPVAILICGNLDREIHDGFWVQDCSAATENLLLQAEALKLGAVWLGVYPLRDRVEGFKRIFGLPESVVPLALVPVGYPVKSLPPADRFDTSRIHKNVWE